MFKLRYICLAITTAIIITISSCNSTPTTSNINTSSSSSQTPDTEMVNHSGHGTKAKININNAILSELDKLEAKLGVPALSNKIQASRPYASSEDLVSKKVITQEQFNQIKDLVSVQEVKLTGVAKDVNYLIKLGLMKGHLLVAKELLDQNLPKQAQPHIGHPVEEIYIDIEEQLNERKVKEFKSNLVSLVDLLKSKPNAPSIKSNFTTAMTSVDGAIAALPTEQRSQPDFVLQVMNGLLDAANSEYGAAIANGKITAPIEYQDSRGFVTYSNELYKGISSQVAQANPEVHKAIDTSLAELSKTWPSVVPPAQAVKIPSDVTQLVKTIEQNSQKLLTKSGTEAQK